MAYQDMFAAGHKAYQGKFVTGYKFTTECDGLRTFKVLYRGVLLPYKQGLGYTHGPDSNGPVAIIKCIKYSKHAPMHEEAGRKIGKHGIAEYLHA